MVKVKHIRGSYENITGYVDGEFIYIDSELLESLEIKGKLIKKRTRTWLVKK